MVVNDAMRGCCGMYKNLLRHTEDKRKKGKFTCADRRVARWDLGFMIEGWGLDYYLHRQDKSGTHHKNGIEHHQRAQCGALTMRCHQPVALCSSSSCSSTTGIAKR